MVEVKVKKGEVVCHDCEKSLGKGDLFVTYETDKGDFHKCDKCYEKNEVLQNFNETEVYSRIVGYIRPVQQWNVGKSAEYKDRKEFVVKKSGCCA